MIVAQKPTKTELKILRRRRIAAVILLLLIITVAYLAYQNSKKYYQQNRPENTKNSEAQNNFASKETGPLASAAIEDLPVRGRASKTGYSRAQFGDGWAESNDCDTRNKILQEQLTETKIGNDGCVVLSGILDDPYTAKNINFSRGEQTSDDVQIDHVVALSDGWQKGAQNLDFSVRQNFANDPLNLLAVEGQANQDKGNSDAASWLPPNKAFRCQYVARQIAVKLKYDLWVSLAESAQMRRVLGSCPEQRIPES